MELSEIINKVSDLVWGAPLIILCLGAGIIFSVWTRFFQLRHFKNVVVQLWHGKESEKGLSSLQSFAMALGGRVGTGNIAGVATAIALGGPGALFWMWVLAFLGAGSAFIEDSLAQVWKEKRTGEYRGGPAYYIERGLGLKWYASIFAVATVISCGLLLPGIQSNSIALAFDSSFGIPTWISGTVATVLLALVIFGGARRIGRVAQVVVPFMAIAYMIMALAVVVMDIDRVPAIFGLIFSSAFGAHGVFGGIVGSAIAWGVKRGIFSNEAGQGSSPIAAAAAEVKHPAQQGIVQAFSVYVDTIGVCTATGLMILLTDCYNVIDKVVDGQVTYLVHNLPDAEIGPHYTQAAIDTIMPGVPGFGSGFVAIALFFFAFTTVMAYAYYAESNMAYLIRNKNGSRLSITGIRTGLLCMAFYGSMLTATMMWAMGDIGVGLMAWLNLIAILCLGGVGVKVLKDYERQLKEGCPITFEPEKLGIKNTECWGAKQSDS
ncbi:MAG: alanine:cation symporter family protein [Holophagaceae bacterium]|nr:alanine:cation symporter family protein [Holophagaceae bacterium]